MSTLLGMKKNRAYRWVMAVGAFVVLAIAWPMGNIGGALGIVSALMLLEALDWFR